MSANAEQNSAKISNKAERACHGTMVGGSLVLADFKAAVAVLVPFDAAFYSSFRRKACFLAAVAAPFRRPSLARANSGI